ncbi:MAG: hypothetical protein ACOCRO_04030 [Halanaerobiales bacterium]
MHPDCLIKMTTARKKQENYIFLERILEVFNQEMADNFKYGLNRDKIYFISGFEVEELIHIVDITSITIKDQKVIIEYYVENSCDKLILTKDQYAFKQENGLTQNNWFGG